MAWFSNAVADSDAWWHLRTGQYIWENHALPVPDPFAYTTSMGSPAYPGEEVVRHFNLSWAPPDMRYEVDPYQLLTFPEFIFQYAAFAPGAVLPPQQNAPA